MATQTEIRALLECHVVASDGRPIGRVGQVYLDERTGEPEWVTVRTGILRQTFVPLAGARRTGTRLRVPFDSETVRAAPGVDAWIVEAARGIDAYGHLAAAEEIGLYRHYGLLPMIPAQRPPSP
ncbi:MAG TPA: PRC-barrel domain-containing protein [Nonomuraea sp.]|nr:PRC-barrel domain-containing protein [Nonomuraea sp.]